MREKIFRNNRREFILLKSFPIVVLAFFFSMPDARLFGVTSLTLLFVFALAFSPIALNVLIPKPVLVINAPFLYLAFIGCASSIFLANSGEWEDFYYVLNKNKDLMVEVVLALVVFSIGVVRGNRVAPVLVFIEVYFALNAIYFLLLIIGLDVSSYFHQSISDLDSFSLGREPFLGWEPSYTGPVSLLFLIFYLAFSTKLLRKIFTLIVASFMVVMSQSKTVYVMVLIGVACTGWLCLRRRLDFNSSILVMSCAFLCLVLFALELFEIDGLLSQYTNLASLDQLTFGSFITRSETIVGAITLFLQNPFGYGYGNAVLHLSDLVDSNVSYLFSDELLTSSRYARTPKSQFLEFAIGGGVVFLTLYIVSARTVLACIANGAANRRLYLYLLFWMSFSAIAIGERLPYVLVINFIFFVSFRSAGKRFN